MFHFFKPGYDIFQLLQLIFLIYHLCSTTAARSWQRFLKSQYSDQESKEGMVGFLQTAKALQVPRDLSTIMH